nr:hypothetical transcript [Hymenolepis microstoma]
MILFAGGCFVLDSLLTSALISNEYRQYCLVDHSRRLQAGAPKISLVYSPLRNHLKLTWIKGIQYFLLYFSL